MPLNQLTKNKNKKDNNLMVEVSEARLARIENKIDELAKAFATLARTEEKQLTFERDRNEANQRLSTLEKRMTAIEKRVDDNNHTVMIINKLFWLVLAALVGAYVIQYVGK